MDLFTLDSQLRRTEVFDRYESLIWTERFSSYGDFQLVIAASGSIRKAFAPGTHLAINQSTRVMVVETVVDRIDDQGKVYIQVKGPSIEDHMQDRVARTLDVNDDSRDLTWYFESMLPAAIAREIFDYICVDGTIDAGDIFPFYTPGNIYPTDTIPEPSDAVTIGLAPATVYDAIKEICEIYGLGFRLVRNGDESELMFNIYAGNDHSTAQSTLPAVIFSPQLDNLKDVSFLTSSSGYKNVAYVISPDGSLLVYGDGIDPTIEGFLRKVLHVDASDIRYPDRSIGPAYSVTAAQEASIKVAQALSTTTQFQANSLGKLTNMVRLDPADVTNINAVVALVGSTLTTPQKTDITNAKNTSVAYDTTEDALLEALLQQKGRSELAKYTTLAAFDGEVPPNSQYRYHTDYELGDIVEIRNADKVANQMVVTEQIFVNDEQGYREYPTLSVKRLVTPGSWLAEPTANVWSDLTDTGDTWASRP